MNTTKNKSGFGQFIANIFPQKGDAQKIVKRKVALLVAAVGVIMCIIVFVVAMCTVFPKDKSVQIDDATMTAIYGDIEKSKTEVQVMAATQLKAVTAQKEAALLKAKQQEESAAKLKAIEDEKKAVQDVSAKGEASRPAMPKVMPNGYLPKFQQWYNANTDVKAHLKIPGTSVDYPVMQGRNNSFYLNHNERKGSFAWGIPYIDFRATISPEYQSTNLIIYGHSDDKRGLQLSGTKNYKDLSFYQQHPVIQLDTVYKEGQWKVLGMMLEDVSDKNPDGPFPYHNFINAADQASFDNFVNEVRSRSFYDTTVDAVYGDHLMTISTCYSLTSSDFRYVLVAREVRPGEDAAVDTAGAAINADRVKSKRPIQ